jgi:hypothetical protein
MHGMLNIRRTSENSSTQSVPGCAIPNKPRYECLDVCSVLSHCDVLRKHQPPIGISLITDLVQGQRGTVPSPVRSWSGAVIKDQSRYGNDDPKVGNPRNCAEKLTGLCG